MTGKMRVAALPLLSATWALVGCTPAATSASLDPNVANPITAEPQLGRCHMGGCGWFQIRSFEVVRETEEGALIRLDMRDGGSKDDDRPNRASPRGLNVDWGPYRNDEYVFCSTLHPAVISPAEGGNGFEAYRIDLLLSAGATEYVTNVYSHVCHTGVDMEAEGAPEGLGYTRFEADDAEDYVTRLSSPEAIFDQLGANPR